MCNIIRGIWTIFWGSLAWIPLFIFALLIAIMDLRLATFFDVLDNYV